MHCDFWIGGLTKDSGIDHHFHLIFRLAIPSLNKKVLRLLILTYSLGVSKCCGQMRKSAILGVGKFDSDGAEEMVMDIFENTFVIPGGKSNFGPFLKQPYTTW